VEAAAAAAAGAGAELTGAGTIGGGGADIIQDLLNTEKKEIYLSFLSYHKIFFFHL
jgi:hypothetical protein